jgi:CDP-6-deoxy-D-xylo-4-hexulose-3-dehydrase
MPPQRFSWPLMNNNIIREDLDSVVEFLNGDIPVLTQSANVAAFEEEWSRWLGVKYSVFVNSGSSANLVTMAIVREMFGPGEIIVPPLTWVSDIAAVLHAGLRPRFVDIDRRTLGMDVKQVLAAITPATKAVFLTHVLGFNAITEELLTGLQEAGVPLVEDCCESHGASAMGKKVGSLGLISNFSFYFAHHMSAIEGGMISTNDPDTYQMARMFRSHGMVRESTSEEYRARYRAEFPELNPEFIFAFPAYNVRSTEIQAVIARSQLKRLDGNNVERSRNFQLFLDNLDPDLYQTDFTTEGSCNYALTLVLREPDQALCERVMATLSGMGVEFRRGASGGGNQLRQPYLLKALGNTEYKKYPCVEHIHFFGFYIGNYPGLESQRILDLCSSLNQMKN